MPNPYHDETGKFCSKEEMFNGVLRLQLAGKTDEATTLFMEYKEAEGVNFAELAASSAPVRQPVSTKSSTKAEAAPTPAVDAEVAADNARVQAKADALNTFFQNERIDSGEPHNNYVADEAYRNMFDRERFIDIDDDVAYSNYDSHLYDEAQRLTTFTEEDGTRKTLFAFREGLYLVTESTTDSWGSGSNHGYDAHAVEASASIVEGGMKTGYVPTDSMVSVSVNGQSHARRGKVVLSDHDEESQGHYVETTIYKTVDEDGNETFYRQTIRRSSWDTGYNSDREEWDFVAPKEFMTRARLNFERISSY